MTTVETDPSLIQAWELDKKRYSDKEKVPPFQKYFRKAQSAKNIAFEKFYAALYTLSRRRFQTEISYKSKIGPGLYINHPYCITINPAVIMGKNINLHKGVTIGQENRGSRAGCPVIGDCVWIGANSAIVGKITIGDDVMIAPNSFVNCDVPSHSVVFGNPCIIKHRDNATENYINRSV